MKTTEHPERTLLMCCGRQESQDHLCAFNKWTISCRTSSASQIYDRE